ncbi:hypothetical protein [Aquipuribacter sp. MA13-6]|uniref:hypothetical protein n=1 Tax=unclassified Aquipuribacter TaxID=2635084 RepID=UPI003EE925A6
MTTRTHQVDRHCWSIDARTGLPDGLQLWGPDGSQRLRVHVVPDDVEPPAPLVGPDLGWAVTHVRARGLAALLDMLRHDHTIRVTMADDPPGAVFVHTGDEPMGLLHPNPLPPAPVLVSAGTATLRGTATFDLETGTAGTEAGRDLWWEVVDTTTRRLRPQNGALLCPLGVRPFEAVTTTTLAAADYSPAPVDGNRTGTNRLRPGSVVAVRTAAGNLAKLEVLSYGYDLQVRWATYRPVPGRVGRQVPSMV